MKVRKSHLNTAAIALGVLAIVLGGATLLKKLPPKEGAAPASPTHASADQILTPPSADASEAERKAYFDRVTGAAQKASALTIGSLCTPTPLVMNVALQSTLTIKNTDTVDHTIVFDKDHRYLVPKGGSKTLTTDLGHTAGIYGYGCDTSTKAVGMLVVTPQ